MEKERKLLKYVLSSDVSGILDLLESGADPNLVLPEGAAPLHIAAGLDVRQVAVVGLLLQNGASPNIRSSEGETPLHVSATYDKCNVLKLLLLNGADPDVEDEDGRTPLDCAREAGCDVCVLNLMQQLEAEKEDDPAPADSMKPCAAEASHGMGDPDDSLWSVEGAAFGNVDRSNCTLSFHTCSSAEDLTLLAKSRASQQDEKNERNSQRLSMKGLNSERYLEPHSIEACTELPFNQYFPEKYIHCLNKSDNNSDVQKGKTYELDTNKTLDVDSPWRNFDSEKEYSVYKWAQSVENWNRIRGNDVKEIDFTSEEDFKNSFSTMCTQDFEPDGFDVADLSLHLDGTCEKPFQNLAQHEKESVHEPAESFPVKDNAENQKQFSSQSVHQSWFSRLRDLWHHKQKPGEPDKDKEPTDLQNQKQLGNPIDGQIDELDLKSSDRRNFQRIWHDISEPHSTGTYGAYIPRSSSRILGSDSNNLDHLSLSSISLRSDACNLQVKTTASPRVPVPTAPSLNDIKPQTRLRRLSSASSTGTIQYIYTDEEEGFSLLETWFPTEDSPQTPSPLASNFAPTEHKVIAPKNMKERGSAPAPLVNSHVRNGGVDADLGLLAEDNFGDVETLKDSEIRARLVALGDNPGPITMTTRMMYKRRLLKLEKDPGLARDAVKIQKNTGHNSELKRLLGGDLDSTNLQELEDQMCKQFCTPDPTRGWREGTKKSSFNYLLLDPQITCNLPARVKVIGEKEAFRLFISSIFYVGKGKRARPYAHFKEAIQQTKLQCSKKPSAKVHRILDIWSEGLGVISLHVFQNVIPVEAYTREAAMIDAMGRHNLTNIKAGEYYGVASGWSKAAKHQLGVRLLHKSFRIFLSEGERHIRPADLHDK